MSKCDVGGIIQGVVSEDGVVKVNSPVYLYDRDSGKLLQRTRTAADGSFYFKDVDRESASYMVLATDEDGVAKKNALVFDRIQPVNDTAGAPGWDYNWPTLVRGKEALVAYTPRTPTASLQADIPSQYAAWTAGADITAPASGTGYAIQFGSDLNVFPGIPGCPSLQVRSARIRFRCQPGARQLGNPLHGPMVGNHGASGKPKPTFTFEAAVNFSTSSILSHEYNYGRAGCSQDGGVTQSTDALTTVAFQVICGTNRYINVLAEVLGGGFLSAGVALNNSSYVSQVAQFNVTSAGTGWKHVAVVVSYETGDVSLYINGALFGSVNSASLSSFSPSDLVYSVPSQYESYGLYSVPLGLFLTAAVSPIASGYIPNTTNYLVGNSTTFVDIGPFALYEVALSAEEVELHYRAMMTTSLQPLLSGYARKIADLRPLRYWRLDGEDGQEVLTEAWSTRPAGGHLKVFGKSEFVPGPMSGRKAIKLGANTLLAGETAGIPINRARSTVMCWVFKEAGKPVPVYILHGGRKFGTSTFTGTDGALTVLTSGAIQFGESLSGSMYYWSSAAGAVPDGVWTHIAVSINTATLRCEYYVNGTLFGETVANSGSSTFRSGETNSGRYLGKEDALHIGGSANIRPIANPASLGGALADLAFFGSKLSSAQILDIYNARLDP